MVDAPRLPLACLPTPVRPCRRLTEALGGPRIWVKRDDLTGLGGGGNKVRKLEFAVAEAIESGADALVTIGVTQSNAVRQTAAAAAAAGLACHAAVVTDRVDAAGPEYERGGNALLTRLFGAVIHAVSVADDRDEVTDGIAAELRTAGRRPYVIPYGVSSVTGALGYVAAAEELAGQRDAVGGDIDVIVHATGSAGTQAGLVTGAARHLQGTRVIGVDVDADADRVRRDVLMLSERVAARLGVPAPDAGSVEVLGGYAGTAYGSAPPATLEAITLAARTEGLVLDPVYTGTAAAGLVGMVDSGRLHDGHRVLFLHTGGSPGLFAYGSRVTAHLAGSR